MSYSPFTTAETAENFRIRQAWTRKVKDDFDDHELRLLQADADIHLFEHFIIKAPGALAEVLPPLFEMANVTDITLSYPAFSVIRFTSTASGPLAGLVYRRPMNFGKVVPPIKFKARLKRNPDSAFHAGLKTAVGVTDVNGVWLERVDASNWRFVSYNGARNNGTSFASVATGTWFEVEIVFTNSPSTQALCYLNGVLKETLVTQLPTTSDLYAVANTILPGTTNWFELDRWEHSTAGIADAA